ncbi:hypothetical protein LCGC14_2853010, partial [marine sediment metagenome]
IPIITCNFLVAPRIPETIECVNAWDDAIQKIKQLRAAQPDAPMLVTEFWAGWYDHWGGRHQVKGARESARRALEILGTGAQVNYYMWHGGTNFAFWGSRLSTHDWSYQTTSYDYDAPLAEGGGLTEKYYLTRLVNMMASHFGFALAQGRMDGPDVTVHSGTQVLSVSGPGGRMTVVTNNGQDDITTATVSLPTGELLEVPLEPLGAVAIPVGVRIGPETVLDYANIMPLGMFGENNLVLHGPAGWPARISVNGKEVQAEVPPPGEVAMLEHGGQRIVLLDSDLAMRAWEVDGTLLIGPSFVGETVDEVRLRTGTKELATVSPDGTLTRKKVKPQSARKPTAPRLGQITRLRVCDEPINSSLKWEKLDRPRDISAMGITRGYGWVRVQLDSPKAMKR